MIVSLNHLSYPSFYPTIVCVRARASVCARGVSQYAHFLSGGRRRRVLTQLRSHAAARPGKCISMFAHSSVHSFVRSFVCLFVRPLLGTRFDSDVGAQRLDTGAFRERRERRSQVASLLHSQTNCGARAAIGCWGGQLLAERLSVLRAELSRDWLAGYRPIIICGICTHQHAWIWQQQPESLTTADVTYHGAQQQWAPDYTHYNIIVSAPLKRSRASSFPARRSRR